MSNDWFFEKFALIADAPGAVERMRGLVLEAAVRGKLVRQDPNDDPADELLEKIRKAED
jgi:type I restriction enzyme S subunit